MESAPRLPMLSCELKISPTHTVFGPTLKKYIAEHYHEDPDAYNNEIEELQNLRMAACKVPRDFTGCSVLKRYYSQLLCLQSRFPMTDEGPACVPFMWTDIYSGMVFNIIDIKYEQASILYNIGALHSKLGAMENRNNSEGMKIACTHFQCAAWALQQVRDAFPQPKGSDMSHDLLSFFVDVFLAQAQECILEKSMLDGRKSSITAKVAAQVVEFYKAAVAVLVSGSNSMEAGCIHDIVGSKLFKGWKKFLEFKMAYYGSVSCLHMGNQAEESQKIGDRQAWYQLALDKLNEAISISKGLDRDDLGETLSFAMDVIGGKFNAAKRENDFVYHDKVPAVENLPEIKGATLVKGIAFSPTDPEICGPDIFARLVPMEAHEASSIYSEEKAQLLRSVTARIENKDEELSAFMSSLNLDRSVITMDMKSIPQELIKCCAALSVRPTAASDLVLTIQGLNEIYNDVDKDLKLIEQCLKEERGKEAAHSAALGKRAPSNLVTELSAEFAKYQEAHLRAADSNSNLQKALTARTAHLKLLSGPLDELEKALPSMSLMDVPNNEAVVKELTHLLDKVDEMKEQRKMLDARLRDALQKDDITKQIVTRNKSEDIQVFFANELKKHDQDVSLIDQNLMAQDNILRALTQANARFGETRKAASEVLKRREAMINSLITSFQVYEDLVLKTQKGTEFYKKLQGNVKKLLTRLKSVTQVQDEERTLLLEAQARKAEKMLSGSLPGFTPSATPKLKDYLPYMTSRGAAASAGMPPASGYYPTSSYMSLGVPQHTALDPCADKFRMDGMDNSESLAMGVRPTPLGSEKMPTGPEHAPPSSRCLTTSTPGSYVPSSQYSISKVYGPQSNNTAMYEMPSQPPGYSVQMPAVSSLAPAVSYGPAFTSPGAYSTGSTHVPTSVPPLPQQKYGTSGPYYSHTEYVPPSTYSAAAYPASTPTYTFRTSSMIPGSTVGFEKPPSTVSNYNAYTSNTYAFSQSLSSPQQPKAPSLTAFMQPPSSNSSLPQGQSMPNFYGSGYGPGYGQLPAASTIQTPASYAQCSTNQYGIAAPQQHGSYQQPASGDMPAIPASQSSYSPYYQYYGMTPASESVTGGQNGGSQMTQSYPTTTWPQQQQQQQYSDAVQSAYGYACSYQQYGYQTPTPESAEAPVPSPVVSAPQTPLSEIPKPHTVSQLQPIAAQSPTHMDIGASSKDLLSTTPDTPQNGDVKVPLLQPKVLTSDDLKEQLKKAEELEHRPQPKDPLSDPVALDKFIAEVERFEKFVEGLTKKSLNGPTLLEQRWKEYLDAQDRESRKLSISVARCYPMKNRIPDVMPYDHNRVEMTSQRNDYINASHIKGLTLHCPNYIVTQAPIPSTYSDFWAMIWEQQAELIVCLQNCFELKSHIYWPMEKGQQVQYGALSVTLQSAKEKQFYIERMINVANNETTKASRVIVHLQLLDWPLSGGASASPAQLLQFVSEVHSFHKMQRNLARPIVLHCLAGVGRSGIFCLVSAAIKEMAAGNGLLDILGTAVKLVQHRKFIFQEKEHFQFCYDIVLYHAQDLLIKRGILTNKASFGDKPHAVTPSHVRHPSEDFILGTGGLSCIQKGLANISLSSSDVPPSKTPDSSECAVKPTNDRALEDVKDAAQDSNISPCKPTEGGKVEDADSSNLVSSTPTLPYESPVHDKVGEPSADLPARETTVPASFAVTSLLDPASFTLDPVMSTGTKQKITKESFNAPGLLSQKKPDPSDPLSQLDPLWSLKKGNE
uniref:Putative tyrosine-protein phosphatase non-receptor type 23 n=1 Tax=Ornithodoros turicata TaxID=34597 RepID=A0A2R5LL12_9ACAR